MMVDTIAQLPKVTLLCASMAVDVGALLLGLLVLIACLFALKRTGTS